MPRFPVTFRRKSTAAEDPNGPVAEHSFRVLERPEVGNGKSFDGGVRLARMTGSAPRSNVPDLAAEDNLFAGLKNNRYVQVGSYSNVFFFFFFFFSLSFSIFTTASSPRNGPPGQHVVGYFTNWTTNWTSNYSDFSTLLSQTFVHLYY
ncbi:hypothetical protein F4811DRAFT_149223 [Daldinia bambusicola]|nr:hypothetical protein F4811DRAFT_149223 [Daldinia bambusicola]